MEVVVELERLEIYYAVIKPTFCLEDKLVLVGKLGKKTASNILFSIFTGENRSEKNFIVCLHKQKWTEIIQKYLLSKFIKTQFSLDPAKKGLIRPVINIGRLSIISLNKKFSAPLETEENIMHSAPQYGFKWFQIIHLNLRKEQRRGHKRIKLP